MSSNKTRGKNQQRKKIIVRSSGIAEMSTIERASLRLNVLPRRLTRVLPFSYTSVLTVGTSGVVGAINTVNLTSIFDPITNTSAVVVASSPYGRTQLATWYSRYLVMHARIIISTSTPGGNFDTAVVHKIDTPNSFLSIAGQAFDVACMTPMQGVMLVLGAGRSMFTKSTLNIDPWKVLGITSAQYRDNITTYGGLVGAAPTASPTLQVGLAAPVAGAAGQTLAVQIQCFFTTEFSEPKELASSP
jgi:hypothetical protein